MIFTCSLSRYNCSFQTVNFNWYIQHIWDHHALTDGFNHKCDVLSCTGRFTKSRCYRRHLRHFHPEFHITHLKNTTQHNACNTQLNTQYAPEIVTNCDNDDYSNANYSSSDEESYEQVAEEGDHIREGDQVGNDIHEVDGQFDYQTIVSDMLLELREKFGATNAALSFVSEKMTMILRHDASVRSKKVSISLNQSNLHMDFQSEFLLKAESPFIQHFESFGNTQTLDRFIQSKPEYVAPVDIPLEGKDKFYYIPVKETLRNILSKDDVIFELMNFGNNKIPGVLKDFSDGSVYNNNELYQSKPKSLQIAIYHDDFQINNPLGNKTKKGKLSGFYFVLGNLKPHHRSRLKDIHLLTMSDATNISKYGYGEVLAPLIKDLKSLEVDGLDFTYDDVTLRVYGTISMAIGDNLALHALGGYYENFSTVQRFCRFCNRTMDSINDHNICDVLRTKEAYDCQLALVIQDSSMTPLYGIKRPCVLNDLNHFHIVDGAPGDLAHDVFEGFAQDLMIQIVVQFVKDRLTTLEHVNELILDFSYASIDQRNKPQPIKIKALTNIKLRQTACEMWNFIRLFPLIFGDLGTVGNIYWKLGITFVRLVELLCAHKYSDATLKTLDEKITEFISMYISVFPDANVKPKLHFITHYPHHIKKFGPLIKTLRFESKHSYFKRCIANSRNRVNVSLSMARHHQMLMYMEYKQKNYFDNKLSVTSGKEVKIEEMPPAMQTVLASARYVYGPSLLEAPKLSYKGQEYCKGCAVVVDKSNDVVFGEVVTTFVSAQIPLILYDRLSAHFNPHFNAYSVQRTGDCSVMPIEDLYDYHPLGIYKTKHGIFVNLRHFIF